MLGSWMSFKTRTLPTFPQLNEWMILEHTRGLRADEERSLIRNHFSVVFCNQRLICIRENTKDWVNDLSVIDTLPFPFWDEPAVSVAAGANSPTVLPSFGHSLLFLAFMFLSDALLTILNVHIMNLIFRNHQTAPFTCKYRTIKSENTQVGLKLLWTRNHRLCSSAGYLKVLSSMALMRCKRSDIQVIDRKCMMRIQIRRICIKSLPMRYL